MRAKKDTSNVLYFYSEKGLWCYSQKHSTEAFMWKKNSRKCWMQAYFAFTKIYPQMIHTFFLQNLCLKHTIFSIHMIELSLSYQCTHTNRCQIGYDKRYYCDKCALSVFLPFWSICYIVVSYHKQNTETYHISFLSSQFGLKCHFNPKTHRRLYESGDCACALCKHLFKLDITV